MPQAEAGALADGLLTLIERRQEWPAMGRAGRQHVASNYDCVRLNERWLSLYRSL